MIAHWLRKIADRLDPPQAPSEFEDNMTMLAIDRRQAMRKAFLGAAQRLIDGRKPPLDNG